MKLLLVYGPRPYWPFVHEQDNYLVPQALVYLASAARNAGIETRIVDCMPLKIGYRSLGEIIKDYDPDVVAVGENHALYAGEALRVLSLAKSLLPNVKTVAGGAHFSNTIHATLKRKEVDFIVVGEGERSLVNLLKEISLEGAADYRRVKGIAFHPRQLGECHDDTSVIVTPPESLIEDLDSLGIPAYDMLPMRLYGRAKYLFSPGGTTIHHGRGCTGRCSFCAFWIQMAERTMKNGRVVLRPRYRTRSPELTADETEYLVKKWGKSALVFVDETFNLDSEWSDRFSDEIMRRKLKVNMFAFMRADLILRDEKLGVMEKLVRAGLRHICIGVERAQDEELHGFNKKFYTSAMTRKVFALMEKKYPEVFKQATFIVGIRDETRESLIELGEFAKKLKVDFPAFHPLTPVPGTELWEEAVKNGWLETTDFADFDWSEPVMPSKYLSRREIAELIYDITKRNMTPLWYLKGMTSRHTYKRRMYIWWTKVSLKVGLAGLIERLNPFDVKTYQRLVYPEWYLK